MNQYNSYSDERLIQVARRGDNPAYNQLMERYNAKILQVISYSVSDEVYAKDLSQDVLLKVFKYLPTFKGNCKFSTWLYKITKNTIKNHYRTAMQHNNTNVCSIDEVHSSFYSSPEHQLITMELSMQVEQALSQLSEELRACYRMYLCEGASYEAIAQALHCPIGTVRSRIHRARKALSECIKNQ